MFYYQQLACDKYYCLGVHYEQITANNRKHPKYSQMITTNLETNIFYKEMLSQRKEY